MEEASVAGESPDRSKQRESSAEPTSGSAGSVPEARDPRLGVSRERKSPGGDTATKVLTVRPETPAEQEQSADPEDTALQAAVSTWVREPSPDTPTNADDTAGKAPKADATPETEDEAEEPSDADVDANADAEADGETEAEGSADAKAETDAPSDTGTEAKADADADADADAEAADGGDAPQGPPAADDESRTGGAGGNED
ncbi:D-alanyl-D-alanine carboxypeptidase, partial [Streptomyces olivaceoviridis]